MPVVISCYRLDQDKLQNYLSQLFPDNDIEVNLGKADEYVAQWNETRALKEEDFFTVSGVARKEVSHTLLDFFKKDSPPYKPDEISSLWTGIAGIVEGAESIHASTGLPLDLKPANIVVSSGDDPRNKFSFTFKIIDFESGRIAPQDPGPNGSKTARVIDCKTSKTYGRNPDCRLFPLPNADLLSSGPPELVLGDEINYHVGAEGNLGSLGCIILECAVWISFGERGRLDFIKCRTEETSLLSDYTKSGRGDCFHDGRGILRCVREFGQQIRDHGRRNDETTPKIFDFALRELLVGKDKSQPARSIYSAMKSIIDMERAISLWNSTNGVLNRQNDLMTGQPMVASPASEQEYVSSCTSWTDLDSRSSILESSLGMSTNGHGSSRKESPTIFPTIEDVSQWIKKRKIIGGTPDLLGWKRVQAQLNGRDFIFVIDNCRTMQVYEDQVKTFVHCLAYLVKRLGSGGTEIMCTSDSMNRMKFKHATGHYNFVTENFSRGRGGRCNMEFALEKALNPIGDRLQNSVSKSSTRRPPWRSLPERFNGRKKPVTVIVFTDGIWGSSIGGGAENPIQALISKIADYEVRRSTVAIQFLRFGSSQDGERRLKFLEDDLRNNDGNPRIDIVDTKPVTASIWEILIGPVDQHVDGTGGRSSSS